VTDRELAIQIEAELKQNRSRDFNPRTTLKAEKLPFHTACY